MTRKTKKQKPVEPLKFDLANRKDRIMRLTVNSSFLGDAVLTQKGDKLYDCAAFENGYDLWENNFEENTTKLLIKGVGGGTMLPDKEGENIFLVSGGQLKKIEIKDNSKTKPIAFKAEFSYRPAKEVKDTSIQLGDKLHSFTIPKYMVSIGPDMERHTKNFFRISTITTISQKCFLKC